MFKRTIALASAALAVAVTSGVALAQKAKDTVRIGIHQPVSTIDMVFDPSPQTSLLGRMVLDPPDLFRYAEKELVPGPS